MLSSNELRLVALDLNLVLPSLCLSDVVGRLQPYHRKTVPSMYFTTLPVISTRLSRRLRQNSSPPRAEICRRGALDLGVRAVRTSTALGCNGPNP